MNEVYVLGIDIGTGSTKAVALNRQQAVVATAQQHYASLPAAPGIAEQSVQQIWEAMVQCINDVVAQIGKPPAIISFSACMHSLLAVDGNGHPLTNMITWADARSQAIAEDLRQSAEAENLYKATGTPLHSMSPLSKIIWFSQKEKETFAKAAKWISIKEYIWWRLFGVYEVDVSIATASGMMNVHQMKWHQPALQLAQINELQLSTIQPTTFMRSKLTAEAAKLLPQLQQTLFCIGSSDGCMATIGSGALPNGVGALTIGTSAAVRVVTQKPVPDFNTMLFSYPVNEALFISGAALNNGGNAVHWAIKKLAGITHPDQKDYETFYQQINEVPPGAEGLLCLPYFIGERAPVWDERSRGVFVGVKSHHTQAHFYRATLEGVCFALYQALQPLEKATFPLKQLQVSGGFIRSNVWLQMLADITGKRLCVVAEEDASATGAALLALDAKGWINLQQLQWPTLQTTEPNLQQHQWYKPYFDVYKTLYPLLQNAMHQLHALPQNV